MVHPDFLESGHEDSVDAFDRLDAIATHLQILEIGEVDMFNVFEDRRVSVAACIGDELPMSNFLTLSSLISLHLLCMAI